MFKLGDRVSVDNGSMFQGTVGIVSEIRVVMGMEKVDVKVSNEGNPFLLNCNKEDLRVG